VRSALEIFFLLNDNAPTQKAASVYQLLIQNNVTILHHTTYSPDLFPLEIFLFPKVKIKIKLPEFADVADIQEDVND